jgi:hypothetical protein
MQPAAMEANTDKVARSFFNSQRSLHAKLQQTAGMGRDLLLFRMREITACITCGFYRHGLLHSLRLNKIYFTLPKIFHN